MQPLVDVQEQGGAGTTKVFCYRDVGVGHNSTSLDPDLNLLLLPSIEDHQSANLFVMV